MHNLSAIEKFFAVYQCNAGQISENITGLKSKDAKPSSVGGGLGSKQKFVLKKSALIGDKTEYL